MFAVLERLPVAKKMGRPRKGRDDISVKLDRKVASRIRMIANDRGVPFAEVLTEFVRPIADKEYFAAVKKLAPDQSKPSK
jgi:hypothetical protein